MKLQSIFQTIKPKFTQIQNKDDYENKITATQ